MALTIAKVKHGVMGSLKYSVLDVTFDASYPTGGESLTHAQLGVEPVLVNAVHTAGGRELRYDYSNQTLMAFEEEAVAAGGPLVQTAAATDLSTVEARVFALGL